MQSHTQNYRVTHMNVHIQLWYNRVNPGDITLEGETT